MKLKPEFDPELMASSARRALPFRPIGQLMIATALGGLMLAVWPERSRSVFQPIVSGGTVRAAPRVFRSPVQASPRRDPSVIVARPGIDEAMIVTARTGIDEAMIVNPEPLQTPSLIVPLVPGAPPSRFTKPTPRRGSLPLPSAPSPRLRR